MRARAVRWAGLATLLLAGCTPALDWREVRPAGAGLALTMPCRPDAAERALPLAGSVVAWQVYACSADGLLYALAWADVAEPARVGPALLALAQTAQTNLRGRVDGDVAAQVPGMTPQPAARRWRIVGSMPNGQAAVQDMAVFAHGTRVFQATLLGSRPAPEQGQAFFDSLRVLP